MYVLTSKDAERCKDDPTRQKVHSELINLGLVHFDSGYANFMQGLQHSEKQIKTP